MILSSRIHSLSTFDTPKAKVYLKREDELGFGISGCKKRKYISLLPYLQENKYEIVYIIGGQNSNNLVGLSQVLNEAKIPFLTFIKAQKSNQIKGNSFLLNLLTTEKQRIYVSNEQWHEVEQIAHKHLLASHKKGYIIPEGASCPPAIEGLTTLMLDIQRNEKSTHLNFDHIFIDSGTAYTAGVLVAMNQHLQRKTNIHIVHIAGDIPHFTTQYQSIVPYIQEKYPISSSSISTIIHHFPTTAPSFGSVNATIKQFIITLAQTEGVLTDPVYTAKLLYTAKHIIHSQILQGNILIIHSGGGTGLMGFDFSP